MYLKVPQYRNVNPSDTVARSGQISHHNIRLPEWVYANDSAPEAGLRETAGQKALDHLPLYVARIRTQCERRRRHFAKYRAGDCGLKKQLDKSKEKKPGPHDGIFELRACRFNSGLFGVDWALTGRILKDSGLEIVVVRPPRKE
ncbi:hypothetical protein BDW66DRAFT_133743 [Aspergillus desertorum]